MDHLQRSLESWLRLAVQDDMQCDLRLCRGSDLEYMIVLLGTKIFDASTIQDIYAAIEQHFGYNMGSMLIESLHITLEACLICALHRTCQLRNQFVQIITGMPENDQENLMEAIKDNLRKYSTLFEDSPLDCHESAYDGHDEPHHQITQSMTGCVCDQCSEKDVIITQLHQKFEELVSSSSDIQHSLKAEIAVKENRLVDAECLVVEKDRYIRTQVVKISEQQAQLVDFEQYVDQFRKRDALVQKLEDEIAVLKPNAERVEHLEVQNSHLRDKLEELKDIKSQLSAALHANKETHDELLVASTEVDRLNKFKSQVDEYRKLCAEKSIEINTLTQQLHQRDIEVEKLSEQIRNLSDSQNGNLAQTHVLLEELSAAKSQLQDIQRTGGIGDGMCEMNPALMQELERLRAENGLLCSKLQASSQESLNRLESDLADQQCIVNSLQQKWIGTSDELARAKATIACMAAQQESLCSDLQRTTDRLTEVTRMAEEESIALRAEHQHMVEAITQEHKQSWIVFEAEQQTKYDAVEQRLESTAQELAGAESKITVLEDSIASLKQELKRLDGDLAEQVRLREQDRYGAAEEIEQLLQTHDEAVAEERAKSGLLSRELEAEKTRRKRIDREKRLMEEEMHRNKTQLQISNCGSSHDVEAALKEIKTMQHQIESQEAEIQALKASQHFLQQQHQQQLQPSQIHTCTTCAQSVNAAAGDTVIAAPQGATRVPIGAAGASRVATRKRVDSRVDAASAGTSAAAIGDYLEQVELADKRVVQLQKEKRELIAKGLEESKEKMDLSQKLMLSDKQIKGLRDKLSKLELEKERMERRYQIQLENTGGRTGKQYLDEDMENRPNQAKRTKL